MPFRQSLILRNAVDMTYCLYVNEAMVKICWSKHYYLTHWHKQNKKWEIITRKFRTMNNDTPGTKTVQINMFSGSVCLFHQQIQLWLMSTSYYSFLGVYRLCCLNGVSNCPLWKVYVVLIQSYHHDLNKHPGNNSR